MTDAESAVRFHPFCPVPLFFTFIFTPNVVLVSHSIIAYPFPNPGYESAVLALGAWAPSYSQLPNSSTTIPDRLVSKRFLHWRFTDGYRDAVWMTNSTSFVIVSYILYTLMTSSICHLLDNHADFVTLRFTA
jgi:hypothetical protein